MAQLLAWNFDEASGDAADYSGNGRTVTISSGNLTGRVAGHTSTGLQQTTSGISLGPSLTGLQTSARTVMFWLKVNAAWSGWLLEFYRSTALAAPNDTGVWGLLYLSGTMRWRAKNSSNTATDITIAPDTGVWHHIAVTFTGTTLTVYRDGTLLSTGTVSGGLWASGADTFRVAESVGTAAVIDDVRMYDTALDAATIGTLMNTPVSGSSAFTGSVALSGSGTLTGAGSPAVAGSVALSGAGGLAGAGAPALAAAAGLSGSGMLGGSGAPSITGAVDLSGSGALNLNGTAAVQGSLDLSGLGALDGTGVPGIAAFLALSGAGTLLAQEADAPAVPGVLVTANAPHSALTASNSNPLAAANSPSSILEVSHGV
jgi:hypothetical protein